MPAWSPDGSQIAFVSARDEIYVMDVSGNDVRRLTDNQADDFNAVWFANTIIPPTDTPSPTHAPVPPTPGIGSTMVSDKDGMALVYVPEGEFEMGSKDGDSHERPLQTVSLDAYWIDRTEVTNATYEKCVEAGGVMPCSSPPQLTTRLECAIMRTLCIMQTL